MNFFLAMQHTYHGIELGLFQGPHLVQSVVDDKKKASKQIVALANSLLRDNDLSFCNLSFFAANQGPGPFTTLRVVIATVNGFAFATKKKIIGIDGLQALLEQHKNKTAPVTVALLNAYSGDLYFGIQTNNETKKSYANSSVLFAQIKKQFPNKPIEFIGQAVAMYQQELENIFGDNAKLEKNIEHCSIEQIGIMAWRQWEQKENLSDQLFPLYLKSMQLKVKTPSSF